MVLDINETSAPPLRVKKKVHVAGAGVMKLTKPLINQVGNETANKSVWA